LIASTNTNPQSLATSTARRFGVIEAVNPQGVDIIDTLTTSEQMYLNQLAIHELEKGLEP